MIKSFRTIQPVNPVMRPSTEAKRNTEGMTYAEWLCAARFAGKPIPVGALLAWKDGVDPAEFAKG